MATIEIRREMLEHPERWHGDKEYKRDRLYAGRDAELYARWRYRRGDDRQWNELVTLEDTDDLPYLIEAEKNREIVVLIEVNQGLTKQQLVRLVLATDVFGDQRGPSEPSLPPAPKADYHAGADPAEDARRRKRAEEAAERAQQTEAERKAAHEAALKADAERAAYYAQQRAEHEARLAEAARKEAERELKRQRWEAFRADPKWARVPALMELIQPVRPGKGPLNTNGSGVSISEDDTRLLVEYETEERLIFLEDWGHAPHPAHIGYFYVRALPAGVNSRKLFLTFTVAGKFRVDSDQRVERRDENDKRLIDGREKSSETFDTLDEAIDAVYARGGVFPAVTDMDA